MPESKYRRKQIHPRAPRHGINGGKVTGQEAPLRMLTRINLDPDVAKIRRMSWWSTWRISVAPRATGNACRYC